jgi:P27 family predicted phage terminase small subunit
VGQRGPLPAITPLPTAVQRAAVDVPAAPRGLGRPGKAAWRLAWTAAGSWLVPESDGPVVERYARLADEAAELRGLIDRDGRVSMGSMGQRVTAPAVDQLRQVQNLQLRHEQTLGLGPANRARLGLAVLQVEKEMDLLASMRAERARVSRAAK